MEIDNVRKFKFRQNYDVKYNSKQVGTLDMTLSIKSKRAIRRNRGEQGSKIEFQSMNSRSVSLENEEEEDDEEDEEEGEHDIDIYEDENAIRQMHGLIDSQHNDFREIAHDQNIHMMNQNINQVYPASDEEYDSDEDPIPDDEDKDNNLMPAGMNPAKIVRNKEESRPRNHQILKQRKKIRSTSHNKHIKKRSGNTKYPFKFRKASNRPILKEQFTPMHMNEGYRYGKNQNPNLSNAQTHYSPASLKKHGMLEAM